jgi:PDZ domain-containing protein
VRALRGWLDPDVAVVPKETFYPRDKSSKEIQQENVEEMQTSQQNATTAALHQLGIPVTTQLVVSAVVKDTPAVGKLHAGDQIVTVDGHAVTKPEDVRSAVTKHKPGDVVSFGVQRAGKRQQVQVTAGRDPDAPTRTIVGIVPSEAHKYPFTVKIQLDNVAGPSAGLMFALGIIEKLTPDDITGGKFIAGTGTIDDDGKVGPIGGIQMKIIAARQAGAKVFLTPADNCAEATGVNSGGVKLVKVHSLSEALQALTALRTHRGDVPAC